MQEESQSDPTPEPKHFLPRRTELEAFAKLLPIQGTDLNSNRIYNIWGEAGVGKSTFVSGFRESELMSKAKVLWIQPTRDEPLDTIPEFIRACAKTLRCPSNPSKEKKISEQLESVQRGKINPIVSDDSLLITRSSVAKQKKPYVNQAAASSVGRTETIRDDVEINVGLGESKASNHAEGFLDALPLQSLGTDLTLIYIEYFDRLSVTIIDWLRDYVFPSATHGAYRRSLAFIIESKDPLELAYPTETWGVWSNLTEDFRLYPLSYDEAYEIGLGSGFDTKTARYLSYKSQGYPLELGEQIQELKSLTHTAAAKFLDTLPEADQLRVAALSLPQTLHADDLVTMFDKKSAEQVFEWFRDLPDNQCSHSANGKTLSLSDSLRCEAIHRFHNNAKFIEYWKKWAPMGRLIRNVPSRTNRSKLLLLAGLMWIDDSLCKSLFGEQAGKVIPFIIEENTIFNRVRERYRVSDRIRPELQRSALQLNHPGVGAVLRKATSLWESKREELEELCDDIEEQIENKTGLLNQTVRKHKETLTQIRIHDRETKEEKIDHPPAVKLPKWLHFGNSESIDETKNSLKHLSSDLNRQIQELEIAIDELRSDLASEKEQLRHPFV